MPLFADRQQRSEGVNQRHSHHLVVLAEVDSADTGGGSAHCANIGLLETDSFTVSGRQDDLVCPPRQSHPDYHVAFLQARCPYSIPPGVRVGFEGSFLDPALLCGGYQEPLVKLSHGDHGAEAFVCANRQEIDDCPSL